MIQQAAAALAQKGSRVRSGLGEPGNVALIVVPYNADPVLQDAIKQAFKNRKVEARVLYEHDLIGVPQSELEAVAKAEQLFKAGGGQQEAGRRFQNHGVWLDFDVCKNR